MQRILTAHQGTKYHGLIAELSQSHIGYFATLYQGNDHTIEQFETLDKAQAQYDEFVEFIKHSENH